MSLVNIVRIKKKCIFQVPTTSHNRFARINLNTDQTFAGVTALVSEGAPAVNDFLKIEDRIRQKKLTQTAEKQI